MNTFITATSFYHCARNLDPRRCFKQAVEISQILTALDSPANGWHKHPAVQQWRNHRQHLADYGYYCSYIALSNGWRHKLFFSKPTYHHIPAEFSCLIPNHRAILIGKDPAYYIRPDIAPAKYCHYLDPDKNYQPFYVIKSKRYYV